MDGITKSNLQVLCERLNKIRAAWGKPMIVTSGLRSADEQVNLIKAGKSTATKSKHLLGLAADILDVDGALGKFLKDNPKLMESVEIWCEELSATPGWVHIQICSPRSGRRWFLP